MTQIIEVSCLIAVLIYLIFDKWKWVSDAKVCKFCVSFWVSSIYVFVMNIIMAPMVAVGFNLLTPFAMTAIIAGLYFFLKTVYHD